MINANELRIGNFIYRTSKMQPSDNILCTAAEILKEGVCIGYWQYAAHFAKDDEIKKHVVAYENLNPIPLTPEWLRKLSFEYAGYKWVNDLVELTNDFNILNGEDRTAWSIKVNSVHQLQNLYFALTGKELQYELH